MRPPRYLPLPLGRHAEARQPGAHYRIEAIAIARAIRREVAHSRVAMMPGPESRLLVVVRRSSASRREAPAGDCGFVGEQSPRLVRLLVVRCASPRGAAGDACLRPTAGAVSVPLEDPWVSRGDRNIRLRAGSLKDRPRRLMGARRSARTVCLVWLRLAAGVTFPR